MISTKKVSWVANIADKSKFIATHDMRDVTVATTASNKGFFKDAVTDIDKITCR